MANGERAKCEEHGYYLIDGRCSMCSNMAELDAYQASQEWPECAECGCRHNEDGPICYCKEPQKMPALDFQGVHQLGIYVSENGDQISTYVWHVNHGRTVILIPGIESTSLFHCDDEWRHVKEISTGHWGDDPDKTSWTGQGMARVLAHELTDMRRRVAELEEARADG